MPMIEKQMIAGNKTTDEGIRAAAQCSPVYEIVTAEIASLTGTAEKKNEPGHGLL